MQYLVSKGLQNILQMRVNLKYPLSLPAFHGGAVLALLSDLPRLTSRARSGGCQWCCLTDFFFRLAQHLKIKIIRKLSETDRSGTKASSAQG